MNTRTVKMDIFFPIPFPLCIRFLLTFNTAAAARYRIWYIPTLWFMLSCIIGSGPSLYWWSVVKVETDTTNAINIVASHKNLGEFDII